MRAGDPRTYGDLTKPAALKLLRATISGIGPAKTLILPQDKDGKLLALTTLIHDAHAVGLRVHPFTFRSDTPFLPKEYGGDASKEYLRFFELGVDGVFSDFAGDAFAARQVFMTQGKPAQ